MIVYRVLMCDGSYVELYYWGDYSKGKKAFVNKGGLCDATNNFSKRKKRI